MIFWIVAAVMVLAALAALLAPLLRARGDAVESVEYDIEVYRDQLGEMERDAERGLLTGEEVAAARTEISRRMLAADARRAGEATPADQGSRRTANLVAGFIAVLLPAGALLIYLQIGQPGAPGMPLAGRADLPVQAAGESAQERVIGQLREQAEANPGDARAWQLLGDAYREARKYDEAIAAYRRALSLGPAPLLLTGSFGEALMMAADGTVTPEARAAFEAVLAGEPGDPRANYYLAVGDYQAGRTRQALDRWAALVAVSPADAPWLAVVREEIARAAGDLGLDVADVTPDPLPPSAAPGSGPDGLTPEQRDAVAAMTPDERQAMVRDMVDRLAARLQEEPIDLEGWAKLVRARTVLGEQAAAQEALDRALEIFADAPFPRQRLIDLAGELDLDAPEAGGGAPDIGLMVARLAARLEDEPEDLEGWRMLARSYLVLERAAEAREATTRALVLAPDDLDILTLQARAIRAAAGEIQTPESIAVMRRVLELAPYNLEALWFVGQAEADAGNTGRARELLERVYTMLPEDSPDRATLRQRIDELTGG